MNVSAEALDYRQIQRLFGKNAVDEKEHEKDSKGIICCK